MDTRKALVLGANGRFGMAMVQALRERGWQVRAQTRAGWRGEGRVEEVHCDGHDRAAILAAARGCQVVAHALNPSQYTQACWRRDALPMLDNAIAAAQAAGALLLLPGTVYNFGSSLPATLTEGTPAAPGHVFGAIRIEMERRLATAPGLDSFVLTAGDFFGQGTGVWFDKVIAAGLQRGVFTYPGPLDSVHAWTHLADLAEAFARLADQRAGIRGFNRMMMPGHDLTGRQLQEALQRVLGRRLGARALPWGWVGLMRPFSPMLRSMWGNRYLWRRPHALDGRALRARLGDWTPTPLDTALAQSLRQLGQEVAAEGGACAA